MAQRLISTTLGQDHKLRDVLSMIIVLSAKRPCYTDKTKALQNKRSRGKKQAARRKGKSTKDK